jgi:uncharacterized SAM-binding protein YcdF (DUF218 family)
MFFVISKIFSFLLNPLSWIFILLVLAFFKKNKAVGRKFLLTAIIVFYFFSNKFICDEFVRKWEVGYHENINIAESYDVGIVLGGNIVKYDYQNNRIIFRDQADRLMQAIDLYYQGKIKKILLTGGPGSMFFRDQFEASFIKKYLLKIQIPDSVIMVDSVSDNTYENAVNAKKLLVTFKLDTGKSLLFTSSLHMRRSVAIFNKAGIMATAYPTSKITGDRLFNIYHLFIPSVESLSCWEDLIHEWLGYITYKIMGYA